MTIINVKLQENPYDIYIENGLCTKLYPYIKSLKLGDFALIITSRKVYSLYGRVIAQAFKALPHNIIPVPDGEKAKSFSWFLKILSHAAKLDSWNKRLFIVCLGGGTITDLGGFVAAVYKRGTPYIQIPTTLLGQIDAAIGGKTAIDLKEAKNIVGAFYQPKAVFIDPIFLNTLSDVHIKEGIAEAIKYGVISNKNLFYFLRDNYKAILGLEPTAILRVIGDCVRIKAQIVACDEKEKKGLRTMLNFGHTFAHALEAASAYKNLSHGQAVSLGMLYAAKLSLSLGKCSGEQGDELTNLIRLFSLPTHCRFNYLSLYKAMCYDKKFISGKIRMV
ncbi:MAG: 3-dehydroquinate synthase, partial [Candidatus Omnitrophica bacterium]|nr:3-dehydroquinate synthase [Candidatus Omnitrophota bacterium]